MTNETKPPPAARADPPTENAFRELVDDHLGMVYSTALRRLAGDAHLAQDVTQMVFKDLALKRSARPAMSSVAGWLYRHTCFTASKVIRTESRRRARERAAAILEMNPPENETDWEQIAPLLDGLMSRLKTRERDAMILRYFAGRSLGEVAGELDTSEEAARKLVSRGLNKLRGLLIKRGVTSSSSSALIAALASGAAAPAPDGLAAAVSSPAPAEALPPNLLKSTSFLAFMTKLKIAAVVVVIAGAVSFSLWQQSEIDRLGALNDSLRRQPSATANVPARSAAPESDAEAERKRKNFHELMQLRGEVAVLHARLAEQPGKKEAEPNGAKAAEAGTAGPPQSFRAAGIVRVPDGQTLVIGGWPTPSGSRGFVFAKSAIQSAPGQAPKVFIRAGFVNMTGGAVSQAGFDQLVSGDGESQRAALYTADQWDSQMQTLTNLEGFLLLAQPSLLTTGDGKMPAAMTMIGNGTNYTLKVTPQVTPDGGAVDLSYDAQADYPSGPVPANP